MKQKPPSPFRGVKYYVRCKLRRMPVLVNLEFTKRCNARCSFCKCWQVDSSGEIDDYGPIIKKIRPVVVSVSGGEPLMRKGYADLLAQMRPYCHYLSIITNGALLNVDSAERLLGAGVNQISVSLDYLDSRHDDARLIAGLYKHISEIVPLLAGRGYRMSLNTVIMESNLSEIVPLAHKAKEWGIEISYSAYCSLKSDEKSGMVRQKSYGELVSIVEELKVLKRKLKNIKNSDYYLSRIPVYFRDGHVPNCRAGFRWIQVTPDGYVQQCSELPRICHYTEFDISKVKPVACSKCWYTCRGEAEANPLEPKRFWELANS